MALTNRFTVCFLLAKSLTYLVSIALLVAIPGCSSGDNWQTVSLIEKHISPLGIKRELDENGVERIVGLSLPNSKKSLEVLPYLGKLEHLKRLTVSYEYLTEEDLRALPALPNLVEFGMAQTQVQDASLKHLASMKTLKKLSLQITQVKGPGLASLKGFSKLEWLDLHSTPLDDSAIPHIVANFPRLKRLSLANTKVTPAGLMQLVDLHWLDTFGPPARIVGPDPKTGKTREERRRLEKVSRRAWLVLMNQFREDHIASKQKARAAGIAVPPDRRSPFGVCKSLLESHDQTYNENGVRRTR